MMYDDEDFYETRSKENDDQKLYEEQFLADQQNHLFKNETGFIRSRPSLKRRED